MPVFLDPTGRPTYGIAVCARCSRKFFLNELSPDRNSPGLMVCWEDNDEYDPWRLPPRETENIALDRPRPDTDIDVGACYSVDASGNLVTVTCPVDTSVIPSST